jgi:hypothetical protein
VFRWFPTQDGPSHLYNAFVLAHYRDASSVAIRAYLVPNIRLFPNWTMFLIMAPLSRVLPLLVVQQLIVTLCVIAIPLAVLYLQKSFKQTTDPSALLGAALAYSYMLFMGFFNFVFGAALFAFTVGFWWRRRNDRYVIVLYALLIATYLSHALAYAATLMALGVLALLGRRWRLFVELAPAYALFALDAFLRTRGTSEYRPILWHFKKLLFLEPFVYFGDTHVAIALFVMLLLVGGIIFTLIQRHPNPVAWVSAALFVVYFVAPWGYGAAGWVQGGWINDRLLFLAVLTLPAWLMVPRPVLATALASVAILVHFGVTTFEIARFHRQIGDITRAAALVRPHATMQSIFPPVMISSRGTPLLHVGAYLALRPDVVDLDNYEGRLQDFPISFRPNIPPRPPNYLVVWSGAHVRNVAGYSEVFRNEHIRLMQRVQ